MSNTIKTAEEIVEKHLSEWASEDGVVKISSKPYIIRAMEEYKNQFYPPAVSDEEIDAEAKRRYPLGDSNNTGSANIIMRNVFMVAAQWALSKSALKRGGETPVGEDIIIKCLKGAMKEYEDKLDEAYKKAGGIFSSLGPDWYNKAWEFFHKKQPQTPIPEKGEEGKWDRLSYHRGIYQLDMAALERYRIRLVAGMDKIEREELDKNNKNEM